MIIFGVINGKGGVGKTTTSTNLAAAMSTGKKTIILDCDPQGSATDVWFEKRPEHFEYPKLVKIEASDLPHVITQCYEQGYDYVFIDSAGRDAPSNKLIADMSDSIIMPVRPSAYDIEALDNTITGITKDRRKVKIVVNQGFAQGQRNERARQLFSGLEGVSVSPVCLVIRALYLDSAEEGMGVTEMEPNSKAAIEVNQLKEWLLT